LKNPNPVTQLGNSGNPRALKFSVNDAFCRFDVSVGLLWLYESPRYTVSPQFYFIEGESQFSSCWFLEKSQ
jgi:hypothetical protein